MTRKLILLTTLFTTLCFGQKKIFADDMSDFQNGYSIITKGNITSFIDSLGNQLDIGDINLKLDSKAAKIGMQKNGYFINDDIKNRHLGNKEGIRNLKGEYVIKPKYDITVVNGFYILKDYSNISKINYNILNENCNSIFKITGYFKSQLPLIPITNNIIAVSKNDTFPVRYKLVFIKENIETDYDYGDFAAIKDGLIKASKYLKSEGKFKWGFIDEKGETVIDFIYTNPPGDFENNLAVVKNIAGKFGYINLKNEIVIEPKFIKAYGFTDGMAFVQVHRTERKDGKTNNGYRIIDNTGKIIYDLKDLKPVWLPFDYYKQTLIDNNGIFRLRNKKYKVFFLNLSDFQLIETKFSSSNLFDSGLSKVRHTLTGGNSSEGFANKKGELVLVKASREF